VGVCCDFVWWLSKKRKTGAKGKGRHRFTVSNGSEANRHTAAKELLISDEFRMVGVSDF
jgi:hypothetical protein